jgi:acyl-CoA thioester hydrolase
MSLNLGFTWPLRVYWEDTDAGGIVFYANYLKFFERARTEWLRALGVEQHALKAQTMGMFIVSETQLKYLAPARLDDQLWVTARLIEKGRASLVVAQEAYKMAPSQSQDDLTPGPTLCEGRIRIGWVSAETLRPGRIPQTILEKLE